MWHPGGFSPPKFNLKGLECHPRGGKEGFNSRICSLPASSSFFFFFFQEKAKPSSERHEIFTLKLGTKYPPNPWDKRGYLEFGLINNEVSSFRGYWNPLEFSGMIVVTLM